MKRQVKILFHVGYGKTATTWLQRHIFSRLSGILYMGKDNQDVMYDPAFNQLHNELFGSLYGKVRYRSRNSGRLISEYATKIADEIVKQNGVNVVLSNETILGYGNYNAELNMLLLLRVIECLKDKLSDDFNLDYKILVTFREQVSFLQSYFAYDYAHQADQFKTIEEFVDHGIRFHHDDVWGGALV